MADDPKKSTGEEDAAQAGDEADEAASPEGEAALRELDAALGLEKPSGAAAAPRAPSAPAASPAEPPADEAARPAEEAPAPAAAPAPAGKRRVPAWALYALAGVGLTLLGAAGSYFFFRAHPEGVPNGPLIRTLLNEGPILREKYWEEEGTARARIAADLGIGAEAAYALLTDFARYPEFMPRVRRARVVEDEPDPKDESRRVVVVSLVEFDPVSNQEVRSEVEYRLRAEETIEARVVAPAEGAAREIWRLQSLSPAATRILYERFAPAGGETPLFLRRAAERERFLSILDALFVRARITPRARWEEPIPEARGASEPAPAPAEAPAEAPEEAPTPRAEAEAH